MILSSMLCCLVSCSLIYIYIYPWEYALPILLYHARLFWHVLIYRNTSLSRYFLLIQSLMLHIVHLCPLIYSCDPHVSVPCLYWRLYCVMCCIGSLLMYVDDWAPSGCSLPILEAASIMFTSVYTAEFPHVWPLPMHNITITSCMTCHALHVLFLLLKCYMLMAWCPLSMCDLFSLPMYVCLAHDLNVSYIWLYDFTVYVWLVLILLPISSC